MAWPQPQDVQEVLVQLRDWLIRPKHTSEFIATSGFSEICWHNSQPACGGWNSIKTQLNIKKKQKQTYHPDLFNREFLTVTPKKAGRVSLDCGPGWNPPANIQSRTCHGLAGGIFLKPYVPWISGVSWVDGKFFSCPSSCHLFLHHDVIWGKLSKERKFVPATETCPIKQLQNLISTKPRKMTPTHWNSVVGVPKLSFRNISSNKSLYYFHSILATHPLWEKASVSDSSGKT